MFEAFPPRKWALAALSAVPSAATINEGISLVGELKKTNELNQKKGRNNRDWFREAQLGINVAFCERRLFHVITGTQRRALNKLTSAYRSAAITPYKPNRTNSSTS